MVVLSIAGARVGAVGSERRPLRRLGDEEEDATVVEAVAAEPSIRRRGGVKNTLRQTQWRAKQQRRIIGQGLTVR